MTFSVGNFEKPFMYGKALEQSCTAMSERQNLTVNTAIQHRLNQSVTDYLAATEWSLGEHELSESAMWIVRQHCSEHVMMVLV